MISELRAKVVDFGLEPGFRGPHPRRAFARCLHASLDSGHHFRREGGVPEPFPARKKILIQGFLPGQARRRRRARRRHRSRGRRARARPRLGLAEAVLLSLLIDPLSSSLASDGGGLITLSINVLSALRVERGRHRLVPVWAEHVLPLLVSRTSRGAVPSLHPTVLFMDSLSEAEIDAIVFALRSRDRGVCQR